MLRYRWFYLEEDSIGELFHLMTGQPEQKLYIDIPKIYIKFSLFCLSCFQADWHAFHIVQHNSYDIFCEIGNHTIIDLVSRKIHITAHYQFEDIKVLRYSQIFKSRQEAAKALDKKGKFVSALVFWNDELLNEKDCHFGSVGGKYCKILV